MNYYYNNKLQPQQGWICPKCGRVNAPWLPTCGCVSSKTTGTASTPCLEYHRDTTHFGKAKGEGVTTNRVEDELQTEYDKGLKLFADIMFDKNKFDQFLEECKAMGIEPQTERSE